MAFTGIWDWFSSLIERIKGQESSSRGYISPLAPYEEVYFQERPETEEEKARRLSEEKASKYGVPEWLMKAIIHVESGWNPYARSWLGAMGLMQIMPETARWLGFNPDHLYDIETNLEAGAKYLSYLIRKYRGNIWDAVSAYQRGHVRRTPRGAYVNQWYVNRVYNAVSYYV